MIAAGFILWTIVRIGGFDSSYPAFPLIAFTPYVALLAVIAALAALFLGLRWQSLVVSTCAALLVIVVAPRAIPGGGPDPAPTGPELRVLTANLLVGDADAADVVSTAAELNVDVLSIAELTPLAANELAESSLGDQLPHRLFQTAPGSNGTGLMSRFPLTQLPAPGVEGNDKPTIIATAALPGEVEAEIYSIHPFPPTGFSAVSGIERYFDAIPAADPNGPLRILAGDFNSTLDNAVMRDLLDDGYVDAADETGGGLGWTWPQRLFPPPVAIDHVVADERIAVRDYEIHGLEGSDHRMVFAALQLPGPPP